MCPHTTSPSGSSTRALPHTTKYVSSYYYMCLYTITCVLILHLPLAARPALFRINLEGIEMSEDLDLHTLAANTEGYSGSDITPQKNHSKKFLKKIL